VHDGKSAAVTEDPPRFAEEGLGALGMEYVEEHGIVDGVIVEPRPFLDDVPEVEGDVAHFLGPQLHADAIDHERIDVERMELPMDHPGGGDGERTVPAAELDSKVGLGCQTELRQHH
jgi:hypothetical protein